MASESVVPLLAAGVSLAFAGAVFWQFASRRRPHQLAWGLGLVAYAVASGVEAFVAAWGWSGWSYRAYFPLAAAPVGLLGLGTAFLLRPGRWGVWLAWAVGVLVVVAAVAPLASPLPELGGRGTELGAKGVPFSNPGRWAFLVLNVGGGLLLIGGALASWWRTRSPGVLLIGVGAVLPAAGGALAAFGGVDDRLMLQFLGVVVMFAGYVRSREGAQVASVAGVVR